MRGTNNDAGVFGLWKMDAIYNEKLSESLTDTIGNDNINLVFD